MKMEEIGFYTLSDERCRNVSSTSRLMRCELIITDRCNFNCPYCRGLRNDIKGELSVNQIKNIIDIWAKDNLKNIRFSGGEPTMHPDIKEIVSYAKSKCIGRIAISTNGSNDFSLYTELHELGVNDFSISLDACCSYFGDMMAGKSGAWEKVVDNIKKISKLAYVTVGIVVTEETRSEMTKVVEFAKSLGVADIRIIPSAQWDSSLALDIQGCDDFPILKYRMNNMKNGKHVRGITESDSQKCYLVLDDMAVAGNYHFPCIIYMREHGNPIGVVSDNMREERLQWMLNTNIHEDPICKKNCLDVCVAHINRARELKKDLK